MALQRAQQLGRYHLLDRIAFGGMAEIYRAKTFDRDGNMVLVAVKRVLAHLTEDDDFLKMLVDEAKIASLIDHPGIAKVYEFSRTDGEYFIAMEFIDGKDVRALLERCRAQARPMPPEHAAFIVAEIAAALHAAHAARDHTGRALRLVHRDVSPANMLCSYAGDVKLCDFGIAKATLSRVKTKTGIIKGKVKYMSPEQAMGRKLDHRSDIFSLGSVLYEMVTNTPPFTAANEMELLIRVRDAKYRPAEELVKGLPLELTIVIDKALTRNRGDRYQSAAELSYALRDYLAREHPGYGRSHLGKFMRAAFEAEIERELRLLESYVIEDADPRKLGENLIADAVGPDGAYSKFTPVAHGTLTGRESTTREVTGEDEPAEESRVGRRRRGTGTSDFDRDHSSVAGTIERLPRTDPKSKYGDSIHDLETVILPATRAAGTPAPSIHAEETRLLDPTRRAAPMVPRSAAHKPPPLPRPEPAPIHNEPTLILDKSKPRK